MHITCLQFDELSFVKIAKLQNCDLFVTIPGLEGGDRLRGPCNDSAVLRDFGLAVVQRLSQVADGGVELGVAVVVPLQLGVDLLDVVLHFCDLPFTRFNLEEVERERI